MARSISLAELGDKFRDREECVAMFTATDTYAAFRRLQTISDYLNRRRIPAFVSVKDSMVKVRGLSAKVYAVVDETDAVEADYEL